MIKTKEELKYYLECDRIALSRTRRTPPFFGDEIWKYQIVMRKLDYYQSRNSLLKWIYRYRYHHLSLKYGFAIPCNVCGPGLRILHTGTIVIAKKAKIGANFCVHPGVNIGATNGSAEAATIGDNVYLAPGVKVIGNVKIGDNVAVGANAVVVHDVPPGITVGGVPAKQISENDSSSNIIKATEIYEEMRKSK